jgi:hypothetical protein
MDVIRKGHEDVKLDAEAFDRIVTWIDLNAPYYPEYSSAYPNNWAGRSPLDDAQLKQLVDLTGMPFSPILQFDQAPGPQVSFERPELSPCLAKFAKKSSGDYRKALEIIQGGKVMLAERPREDMEAPKTCEVDLRRDEKYRVRQSFEARNREAVRTGGRFFEASE